MLRKFGKFNRSKLIIVSVDEYKNISGWCNYTGKFDYIVFWFMDEITTMYMQLHALWTDRKHDPSMHDDIWITNATSKIPRQQ